LICPAASCNARPAAVDVGIAEMLDDSEDAGGNDMEVSC